MSGNILNKINDGKQHTHFYAAEIFFTVLAFCLWAIIRKDYGISWDMAVDMRFGETVRQYFAQGFNYPLVANYPVDDLKLFYSPLVTLTAAIVSYVTGWNIYSCGASLTGLFWVWTFWPVCALGHRLGGAAGAWLSGLVLFSMPVYVGHAFINPKDMPMACATAWMVLACVYVTGRGKLTFRDVLTLGGAYGFVLAVRPGGWFIGLLLCLPLLNLTWPQKRLKPLNSALPGILRWAVVVTGAVALSWLLMVMTWPYAHKNIFTHPIEGMLYARKFATVYAVMFEGKLLSSNALPWNYYFVYFGLTTPLAVIGLFFLGHIRLVRTVSDDREHLATALGVLFVCWFPMACFLVLRMNVYDGIRHFLFIVPMIAVVAGVGGVWFVEHLPRRLSPAWRYGATALVIAISLQSIYKLHPYQYAYYNLLAGPHSTLHERYETDYWVTSYREAAEWVNKIAEKKNSPARVLLSANDFSLPSFANYASTKVEVKTCSGDLERAPWPANTDYFVGTVRYRQWKNFETAPIVHRVARDGILFSVIRAEHLGHDK